MRDDIISGLVVGTVAGVLVAVMLSCSPAGSTRVNDKEIRITVDSARHVACYSLHVYGGDSVSCVPLDSTNSHSIGR